MPSDLSAVPPAACDCGAEMTRARTHTTDCPAVLSAGGPDHTSDLDPIRARHATYRKSHEHPGAFACCPAHASADDVPRLLAEVDYLEAVLDSANGAAATAWERNAKLETLVDALRAELAAAVEQRDQAKAAERARIVAALRAIPWHGAAANAYTHADMIEKGEI